MFRPTRPSSGALKFRGNRCSFRPTAVGVFGIYSNIHTAHLRGNRHTEKDNTHGVEGKTIFTSFINIDRSSAEGTAVPPEFQRT
jgi:hypothetical protein